MKNLRLSTGYINTLRFLSVLFIMFSHYDYKCFGAITGIVAEVRYFYKPAWTSWILNGFTGKYALAIMCLISGYLVAKKFSSNSNTNFAKYFTNRYLRLMLPVAFTVSLLVLLNFLTGSPVDIAAWLKSCFFLGVDNINDQLWCIDDFFFSNIILALSFLLIKNKKLQIGFNISLCLMFTFIDEQWFMACILGGLIYQLCEFIKEKDLARYWWLLIAIPLIWYLPRNPLREDMLYMVETPETFRKLIVACSLLIIIIDTLPALNKFFEMKFLKSVTPLAYSLFVCHNLTFAIVPFLFNLFKAQGIVSNSILFILIFIIKTIIDFALAWITHTLTEVYAYKKISSFIDC